MSSPSTRICPLSGLSSPSTSLIVVDLPHPDPPRMILVSPFITLKLRLFSTSRSSKIIVTSRNSIAGIARSESSTSRNVDSAARSLTRLSMVRSIESCVIMASLCLGAQNKLQRARQNKVGDDHDDRGHYHGRGGRTSDSDGATFRLQSFVTGNCTHQESEEQRLNNSAQQIISGDSIAY